MTLLNQSLVNQFTGIRMDVGTTVALLAAIGVLMGLVLTLLELRQLIAQRKVEMMLGMVPWFKMDNKEFMESLFLVLSAEYKDYDEFARKYGDPSFFASGPVSKAFVNVAGFYEGLGILYRKHLIDRVLINDFYDFMVISGWQKLKPIVLGLREKNNEPRLFCEFEYLANEMKTGG